MPACPWFTVTRNWQLTGRVRMRAVPPSWWYPSSAVQFEVEVSYEIARGQHTRPDDSYDYKPAVQWRSMSVNDMQHPKLRWIVDGPPAG